MGFTESSVGKLMKQQCRTDGRNPIMGSKLVNDGSAVKLTRIGSNDDAVRGLDSGNKHQHQLYKASKKGNTRRLKMKPMPSSFSKISTLNTLILQCRLWSLFRVVINIHIRGLWLTMLMAITSLLRPQGRSQAAQPTWS